MSAPAKFTPRRERRLLALIGAGASVAEAARAVEISRQVLYRHARADPAFAELLRAARERRDPDPFAVTDDRPCRRSGDHIACNWIESGLLFEGGQDSDLLSDAYLATATEN
jgi:hypothetical protein